MKKRVAFATLGCKVNQSETEAMKDLFRARGYEVVDFDDPADVYVVNTCTVTHLADRKNRQLVRRAGRRAPRATIAVVGCWAQTAPAAVEELPEVSVILGTRERSRVVDYVEEAARAQRRVNQVKPLETAADFEELPLDYSTRTRAYLKIEDGCDRFCTYCIIPYARGPVRSRAPQRVRAAAERLVAEGYREIVLTGIHLGLYGRDLGPEVNLVSVLRLLADLPGLERIRLSSLDPHEVTPEILAYLAATPQVCPHLHIPLQSGSNAVLKRMGRPYTRENYLALVEEVRRVLPDVGLTTDIIVGFPGETEEDFAATLDLARQAAFSRLHVFAYSPREGTPAAAMPEQVDPRVKEERSHRLIALGKELALKFHSRHLGRALSVLAEEEREGGALAGYSGNYIRVRFPGPDALMNRILPVRVTAVTADYVRGELAAPMFIPGAAERRRGTPEGPTLNGNGSRPDALQGRTILPRLQDFPGRRRRILEGEGGDKSMADCIFCKIAAKEIPADLMYEDEHLVAFKDINPQAPVHFLVVPKKHIASLLELAPADAGLLDRVQQVIVSLARRLDIAGSGFRVVVNTGENGGQTVPHLHFHVLGGRFMDWPPG